MSTKVTDPNAKGSSGFIWAIVALLVIVAAVIGYIVWNGQGAKTAGLAEREQQDVNMTVEYADGAITLSSEKATKDTPTVELYEDFACPHCADLAVATDGDMKTAIEDGSLNVAIRPLNFLDVSGSLDEATLAGATGHSTKGVAATIELAKSGNAAAYWNLRNTLMVDQQVVYNKWEMKDFADAAKQFGADDATVDAIKDADLKADGGDIAAANAMKLKEETGQVSSPRVIHDGKDLIGDNEDITTWVEKAKDLKA
ncbi:DsbA family protein [Corynebacterium phoceense]|uniref:DsbA family protein n=1 Tax=Corynebacterium phoceense TaxID=1686286 RepID=UPI0018A9038E|nr:thioredoxin domain-containing protein [Corynebacterium phoceense]MBF9011870.1 thioredoxin domain-containing protein [Corynebacterium phoceense]